MGMDPMGFIMITTIAGTTATIDRGGGIIDIDLGILGRITMSLIITDGHTIAHIMDIIPIPIMATIPIIIITDRVTIQIQKSMWQVADDEVLHDTPALSSSERKRTAKAKAKARAAAAAAGNA